MPFLSYAQNLEDVLLWRALQGENDGFYVDVGAAFPDQDSVTRAFYDRGWRGINVEPVPELAARLAAARPRDVNLQVAVGRTDGSTRLYLVADTGLSTTQPDVMQAVASSGFQHRETTVELRTLSRILTQHAPPLIHFLKIDVEGSEQDVLEGCDFSLFRPWIVLVEATAPLSTVPTHAAWEPVLIRARYRHVFFDGLNRYYVAAEQFDRLARHFEVPVNVFDDFRRAADQPPADNERAAEAGVAARAAVAEASARDAYARAFALARDFAEMRHAAGLATRERDALAARIAALENEVALARQDAALGQHLVRSMRASTSWRVSRPIRTIGEALHRIRHVRAAPAGGVADSTRPRADALGELPRATAEPIELIAKDGKGTSAAVQLAVAAGRQPPLAAVHQFHSGSAYGDAITGAMILLRGVLRGLGYRSDIFVEHRDPRLKDDLLLLADLPRHADHVLIVRHSMGHDALDRVLASAAPKILLFHNITPPEFLAGSPEMQAYARLGRQQLATLRPHVVAAIADSEFNALELRALGYAPARACTLLFDLDALDRRAGTAPRLGNGRPYTVLFTGRVTDSKGQAELVEAYARFRAAMDRPCQLVMVGRLDGPGAYLTEVDAAIRRHGLEAEVTLTGLVSEDELHASFAEADLFVCLSHHEGFGVPLVEAIAHGVPVLAWPSGAIPYTLGEGGGLLDSRDPDRVAARMLEIARDPGRRAALQASQRAAIARFALPRQLPVLHEALALAGAVPPAGTASADALRANLRFTVTGHVAGSYSLAAVNRALALSIEAELPGRVRLRPIEGQPTDDISGVPEADRARIAPLVARGPAETGPEIVISQHYPVHLPDAPGGLKLAMLFWEESLLPADTITALAAGFRAVLAPSASVAKALIDSGLPIPVRVTGHAPDLSAMEAVGRERADTAPERGRTHTFLHVSSCFPRKGVDVLLAAYARAFRKGDPVRLVIKGFPNPHNTVQRDVAALQAADPGAPAIEVMDRDLPEEELLDLYRSADALVLPTRGEGFNLPAAEAMAAGVPLIVTGHGGHLDFCDAATARLLRWRFAASASHLATAGSLWVEPDEDDLVAALRETSAALRDHAGSAALAEQVRRARLQVAQRLQRRVVVGRIEGLALDLLLQPPPPPLRVAWITSWKVRCGVAEYARQLLRATPTHPAITSHIVLPDERWKQDARPPGALSHDTRACWRIGDPASLTALMTEVAAEDPHAVVVQHQPGLMPWDGLAALLASRALADRTVIVTLHNTQHLLEQSETTREAACGALARVDRVLVHTIADLERLGTIGLRHNVAFLPHGVKAPFADATPIAETAAPIIGCYGFFLPDKGIAELIQALAILRRKWPEARLRLVNADYGTPASRNEIMRCRTLAGTEGLDEAIEWHTDFLPEDESLRLLAGCTVLVLPTQASKESSSASMRDMLAAGPPVMVTPLAIFEEAGDAVIRAPGVTPASLAESMERLLRDAALRHATQEAARTWLIARSWDAVARRLQGMIIGLAAGRMPDGRASGREASSKKSPEGD